MNSDGNYSIKLQARKRSQRGQGITEGVASILLLITGIILSTLLLLDVGVYIYYKQKLAVVVGESAAYGSGLFKQLSWHHSYNNQTSDHTGCSKLVTQVTDQTNTLLSQAGLPAAKEVSVVYSGTNFDSKSYAIVTVSVTLNSLPLLGNGTILPGSTSLQERAIATIVNDQPPGLFALIPAGDTSKKILCPAYGFYEQGISDGASGNAPPASDVCVLRNFDNPYHSFMYGMFCNIGLSEGQGPPIYWSPEQVIAPPP